VFAQAVRDIEFDEMMFRVDKERRDEETEKRNEETRTQVNALLSNQASHASAAAIAGLTQGFAGMTPPSYQSPYQALYQCYQSYTPQHRHSTAPSPTQHFQNFPLPTTLQTPFNTAGASIFGGSTLCPGNLFANRGGSPGSPSLNKTPTRPDIASAVVEKSLMFDNNENGQMSYANAISAWDNTYGSGPIPRDLGSVANLPPLPLTPGTSPLGSKECFKCGHTFPAH